MRTARFAALALLAGLALAGFGCRAPTTAEALNKVSDVPDPWIIIQPRFSYYRGAEPVSKVYVDLKTKPGLPVTAQLSGDGLADDPSKSAVAGLNGLVRFTWLVNRLGEFDYTGQIYFNNVIVDTFKGKGFVR